MLTFFLNLPSSLFVWWCCHILTGMAKNNFFKMTQKDKFLVITSRTWFFNMVANQASGSNMAASYNDEPPTSYVSCSRLSGIRVLADSIISEPITGYLVWCHTTKLHTSLWWKFIDILFSDMLFEAVKKKKRINIHFISHFTWSPPLICFVLFVHFSRAFAWWIQ